MPPHTGEKFHFHHKSLQVFHIIEGKARFVIGSNEFVAETGQSVVISPGEKHKIQNDNDYVLKFLVISQPSAAADRIEV